MAAVDTTTLNEIVEKETMIPSEMEEVSDMPVPVQRKNRTKGEETKTDNALSVTTIIDNSRVIFLDNDITKSEVHILNENNTQKNTIINSGISETNHAMKIISQSKAKVASFIEKFNSKTVVVSNKSDIVEQISNVTNTKEIESVKICESDSIKNCEQNSSVSIVDVQNIIELENTAKMKDSSNIPDLNNTNQVEKCNDGVGGIESDTTKEVKVPIPAPRNLKRLSVDLSLYMPTLNIISDTISNESNGSSHNAIKVSKDLNNRCNDKKEIINNVALNNKNKDIEDNNILSQSKPTISKKPTVMNDFRKTDKSSMPCKIPVFEKSLSFQDREFKSKSGLTSPAERNVGEFEPKLTKRQRTSSEQCLTSIKLEGEASVIKKLRVSVEQLQQENSTLRKLLESERSAFREQKALFDLESRKEKAESKRREASLESQLRAALKGQTVTAAGPIATSGNESARTATALETAKAAIKALEEKLRVAIEADKKKALELKAQHDANVLAIQQMEREFRTQTVKLLDELKSKERQIEKARKEGKVASPGGGKPPIKMAVEDEKKRSENDNTSNNHQQMEREVKTIMKSSTEDLKSKDGQIEVKAKKEVKFAQPAESKKHSKMAVAEQLHQMEGQISRLENEIQRRDDIIQSLKTSKMHRERRLSQRLSKDNIFKDILSDVDSAVSSAPNSLSPQPSPDLWYRHHDASQAEVEEGLLEAAKKQIQELEKALSNTLAGQKQAQSKVSQLEEQLQDLREHADLLEFRCLELEDSAEKRHSLEELTDSDSGCTSPENRLKNSVSPQLRRSDSGYKSPTRSVSPNVKNQHRINMSSTAFPEQDAISSENYKAIINNLHLLNLENIFDGLNNEEIRERLENIIINTHSPTDRMCLEQVLQLLWNLQALGNGGTEEDLSIVKSKKSLENNDVTRGDFDQHSKSGKIVATVSPYSQKALNKTNDLTNSVDEVDLATFTLREESKKLLLGLQESGIFEDTDWENKSTQTDCFDCICPDSESDLTTEVLRLNQIREQLEKSGAIRNKTECLSANSQLDIKQLRRRDKKKIELYENRIAVLENKLAIYESTGSVRDKKLAQRLQRELDLQTKVNNLEFDLAQLKKNYQILEEERCEFEEAENDTRFHCQELEAEFDILTAKLRDLDDQRTIARNEAECYRQLSEKYEYKIMTMQRRELDAKKKVEVLEELVPVLVCYNIFSLLKEHYNKANCESSCCGPCSSNSPQIGPVLMLEYPETKGKGGRSKKHKDGIGESRSDKAIQYEDSPVSDMPVMNDSETELKMKLRIDELEKRELAYLETLTKGDEMWAEMEMSYKLKLKEMEENERNLETQYEKFKGKLEDKEKKIHEMEENEEIWRQERKTFLDDLKEVRKTREELEKANKRLQSDLSDSRQALDEKEKEHESQMLMVKSKTDYFKSELEGQKKSTLEMESEYMNEVSTLKKDLRRTAEELNAYKESVRELTEVVKTLRENLNEYQYIMNQQKNDYEEKTKAMLNEIKGKSDEMEMLRGSMMQFQATPSARDELENFPPSGRNNMAMLPAITDGKARHRNNDQVTTLITIQAIKNPASPSQNTSDDCTCGEDPRSPGSGKGSNRGRNNYPHGKDNRVSFQMDDCDILYGDIIGDRYNRSDNGSKNNLYHMDSGNESSMYRGRKSPDKGSGKCSCKTCPNSEFRERSNSGGRNSNRDSPRQHQSSNNHCGCSNPAVSCYCCKCRQVVDKQCKHQIPLLLLTKTEGKGKVGGVKKTAGKNTRSKSKERYKEMDKSTSYHSDDELRIQDNKAKGISKPEVPSRKPKVPNKKPNFGDIYKVAPPHMDDNKYMSKMLCESVESCLDDRSYIVCQQVNKFEAINNCTASRNPTSLPSPKKDSIAESHQTTNNSSKCHKPLAGELMKQANSIVTMDPSPIPAPRKQTNSGIKRYHSLNSSDGHFECESLPPIMTHSDTAVEYGAVTAKDLIASFNSISGATNNNTKSEKSKNVMKNVIQPKSIGSFVFDRVNKLTNGLSNARIMGLKRSVSMVADSKASSTTFYADV